MLTRNQIHHRHIISGCNISHPVSVRCVGAVKVVEVTVFEYLNNADRQIKGTDAIREKLLVTFSDLWA